jgi:multiple sugar transport system ATP-binding protein
MGRAIVRDPQVFLFDEPLSNLDAKLRVSMRTEIKNLHQRLTTTTVYVTHDQIEAMTMADKIVVMQDGRVEQIGAPLELYDRPNNLFVAGFIGSPAMNMLNGRLDTNDPTKFVTEDGTVLPVSGSRPEALGRALVYGARPEAITLGGDIKLQVVVIEPTGSESQVLGRIGHTDVTCVFRDRVTVRPGEFIPVSIDPKAVHLFDAANGQRLSV